MDNCVDNVIQKLGFKGECVRRKAEYWSTDRVSHREPSSRNLAKKSSWDWHEGPRQLIELYTNEKVTRGGHRSSLENASWRSDAP